MDVLMNTHGELLRVAAMAIPDILHRGMTGGAHFQCRNLMLPFHGKNEVSVHLANAWP